MNKIIIIGTEPPCSRCKLLTAVVSDKVKELNIDAEVRHIVFSSEEAIEFAKSINLVPGTSGAVAKLMNEKIDNAIKIVPDFNSEYNLEYDDYFIANWSYELDEKLRPFEKNAKNVGILMTPSLIINGELKHSGSVPRMAEIENWIKQLQS
jgi:predicted DsbA family dithiol-disulfide isomerase